MYQFTNSLFTLHLPQVTSTSAVNTVVETLIGDWDFFFDGEVNFYDRINRDELFQKGGFTNDKEPPTNHTKIHDHMSMSMIVGENVKNGPAIHGHTKMSHSRSSSHDTSLILLSDPPLKSSQSNSSLSDTSPTTGSPKLPARKKPKAPVPPAVTPQPVKPKLEAKTSAPMTVSKLLDTSNFSFIDSDPALHVDETRGVNLKKAGSTENILTKPDRPPRPVVVNAECQTLGKPIVRQVPLKDKSGPVVRPVAAPRTTLMKTELERSEENLESVMMREKPAIPDRPVTLMRPASFRAATGIGSPTSFIANERLVDELASTFNSKPPSSSSSNTNIKRNNSLREGRTSESNGNVSDMLQSKQVTMYNIEKQQVSIIDVPVGGSPQPVRRQLFTNDAENKENSQNFHSSNDALNSSDEMSSSNVPPSPRDAKIKRPQVPPPARPRSSADQGDSTNL